MLTEQQPVISNPSLIPMHSLRWVLLGDLDVEHFIAAYHQAFRHFLPLQLEQLSLCGHDIPLIELEQGLPAWLHRPSSAGLRTLFVHVEPEHLQLIITWQRQYISRQEVLDLLCQVAEIYNSSLVSLNSNLVHELPFYEFLTADDTLAESPTCSSLIDLERSEYELIRHSHSIILPAVWHWADLHAFHREQVHAEWLECELTLPAGIHTQRIAPIMNVVLQRMVEVSLLSLNGNESPELTLQIACRHPKSLSLPALLLSLKHCLLQQT